MRTLLVAMVPLIVLAAASLRSDYEAPYRGEPLAITSGDLANIVCESELADTTGYYTDKDGKTILISVFEKQSKRATWILSITGNQATVMHGQGIVRRFQVVQRNPLGLILVDALETGSAQVITISPQNSSFVYSTQNVSSLWNRTNVFVGRCRPGGRSSRVNPKGAKEEASA